MEKFDKKIGQLLAPLAGQGSEEITGLIELPPQQEKGDRAVPCFRWAKALKKSPQAVADAWKTELENQGLPDEFEKVEVAGGYLNFFIRKSILADQILGDLFRDPEGYGMEKAENPPTVVLEFSSPNIAKPFSIGHLRSTNIGMALARIMEARGWNVVKVNHLGDWGTQFGKLISAYRRWGNAELLNENPIEKLYKLYVRWHEDEISDPTLIEEAREWFARLERGDEEAKELWEWFRKLTLKELEQLYGRLGVSFDYYWGESHYIEMLPKVFEDLEKANLTKKSENATIIDLEEEGLGVSVVKKSDESSLYISRDLAAAIHRREKFPFQKMIYVVGAPQQLHFKQLFRILDLLGYKWSKDCEHVSFGHISFGDEAMSTRKGNIVFLADVMNKASEMARKVVEEKNPDLDDKDVVARAVGLGAILFADLSAKRSKDVRFSWEDILSFEGETGPYLQYTLVRTESLLRRFEKEVAFNLAEDTLQSKEENGLIRHLAMFPDALKRAERDREPFLLAQYLTQTAKFFNKFYNAHRVLDASEEDALARILLVLGTKNVLRSGMRLLGIPILERM